MPFRDRTILIADTDHANATISQILFEREGARVEVTDDARKALALVRQGRFDLVVLENRLLGMSGVALAHRIRELPGPAGETPILFVSSDVFRLRATACMDHGVDGFVAKPFEFRELLAKAGGIMEQYRGQERAAPGDSGARRAPSSSPAA